MEAPILILNLLKKNVRTFTCFVIPSSIVRQAIDRVQIDLLTKTQVVVALAILCDFGARKRLLPLY